MIKLLEFIFKDIWTFTGVVILLLILDQLLETIISNIFAGVRDRAILKEAGFMKC